MSEGDDPGLRSLFHESGQARPALVLLLEDMFTMDLVDSRPNDPDWIEFNRLFNVLAARFGARPLLNQTKQLSPGCRLPDARQGLEAFLALREQNDPGGRFLSKYFRDLI